MCAESQVTGIIDRIEDDIAVILRDPDEDEILVPAQRLPDGAVEGLAVHLVFSADTLVQVMVDQERTTNRRQRISAKMAELRARSRRR